MLTTRTRGESHHASGIQSNSIRAYQTPTWISATTVVSLASVLDRSALVFGWSQDAGRPRSTMEPCRHWMWY